MSFVQKAFLIVRFLTNQKLTITLLLLAALVAPIFTINYVELQTTQTGIKKSQMVSFSKGQISNYYNYQYYAKMEVGSPGQKFQVILDTGSNTLWIPAKNCSNCPDENRRFDSTLSETTVRIPLRDHIKYGKGQVRGYYILDHVVLSGVTAKINLLMVDEQTDTEHNQADGIMGLGNIKSLPNVFDLAYKQNQLSSSNFGFQLGLKQLKQPSFFIYNITDNDFEDAVYINSTRKDYWTIPARDISMGNSTFQNKVAIVDSGTSLILLPPDMFKQLNEKIFSQYCSNMLFRPNTRICKCPHQVSYPNLTIVSSSLSFNITPQNYISGAYNRRNCILGIDKTPSLPSNFIILGDIFFHDKTIIFDKQNNRLGFISNAKSITVYPNSNWVYYALDFIGLLGLVAAIFILMLRRKTKTIRELADRLQSGPQTQLAYRD